jgi:threonine dehydrogenase-like Zn-dependent dehydrogenase
MKGVVFLGDRKLELRDFPDPTPGPRDAIREIKASGPCGSDLHNYRAPASQASERPARANSFGTGRAMGP